MRTFEEISSRIRRYEQERLKMIGKITPLPSDSQRLLRQRIEAHRLRLNELYWLVGKAPIPK